MSENKNKILAAYSWISDQRDPTTAIFIPVPTEDIGKKEAYSDTEEMITVAPGMLGVISGAVEKNRTPLDTIFQEAWEERLLQLLDGQVTNSLPTLEMDQVRPEGQRHLEAHGFSVVLDPLQVAHLEMQTPLRRVSQEALERFLAENKFSLRPSTYRIAQALLWRGRGYPV